MREMGKMDIKKIGAVGVLVVGIVGVGAGAASAAPCFGPWSRAACAPIQTSSCTSVTMPNVVGQHINTAGATLNGLGFTSVALVVMRGPGPANTVLGQNPAAGTATTTCASVTLGYKRY